MCNNCSNNCFESVRTDCIEYTGPSFEDLGISQGDSLKSVMGSVLSDLNSLKSAAVEKACEPNTPSTTSTGTSTNTSSSKALTRASVDLSSNIEGSVFTVDYNLSEAISECTADGSLSRLNVTVSGRFNNSVTNVELGNSKSQIGSFSLKPENCPVVLNVEGYVINNNGGGKNISLSREIPCSTGSQNAFVNVTSAGEVSDNPVGDQITSLENNVRSILDFNIDGQDLSTTINRLNTKCIDQSKLITDQQDLISQLEARIDALERTV